jgi:PadR family transcriptional regulator, regulatory protein PadR
MRGEELKGHIDTMVLAGLRHEAQHGYALVQRLKERSEGVFDLGEGTVYPALHRLERDGLIESTWTRAAGRRRRVYALTGAGHAALAERKGEWRTFARGMQALLDGGTS